MGSETRLLTAQDRKSLDSLREAAGWEWLPHCFQLSGYPNTTHHEDIPPRIGTTGSGLWILASPMAEAEGNLYKPVCVDGQPFGLRWLVTAKTQSNAAETLEPRAPGREGKKGEEKGPCREKLPRFPSYPAFLLPTAAVERSETQPRLNLRQSRGRNTTPEG